MKRLPWLLCVGAISSVLFLGLHPTGAEGGAAAPVMGGTIRAAMIASAPTLEAWVQDWFYADFNESEIGE